MTQQVRRVMPVLTVPDIATARDAFVQVLGLGEVMNLGYWSLPETAVDDTDEAIKWARIAIGAALRKASAKKVRKPKVRPAP